MLRVSPRTSVRISGSRLLSASTTSEVAGPTRTSTTMEPLTSRPFTVPTMRWSRAAMPSPSTVLPLNGVRTW
jgi:hypothetical protein